MRSALAAFATLVAVAFALSTWDRWLAGRRRHDLAWTVSLALFALGSLSLLAGASTGWDAATFRAFYLFGAIANVPFLALGTVYLLGGRRRGDAWAVVVCLATAFAAGVVTVAPLEGPLGGEAIPRGSDVFGALPRVLAALASGLGAAVVFAGALWSALRLLGGRRRPGGTPTTVPAGRLAGANLLIAAGTAILSASGLLNSVLGEMDAFAVTLAVGITVIFAGFLVAAPAATRGGMGTLPSRPPPTDGARLWRAPQVADPRSRVGERAAPEPSPERAAAPSNGSRRPEGASP